MSAKHAVLGWLARRPAYPYELADRLQERLGPTWAINSGQLSQLIRTLEREGLIEPVAESSAPSRDRNVFEITGAGEREFERWWSEEELQPLRPRRRPLLVKLALAPPEQLHRAISQVETYAQECVDRINEIMRAREQVPIEGVHVRADHVVLRLSLSADVYEAEAELHWARHAREAISLLLQRDAVWPSSPRSSERSRSASQGAREELFGRMASRHLKPPPPGGS